MTLLEMAFSSSWFWIRLTTGLLWLLCIISTSWWGICISWMIIWLLLVVILHTTWFRLKGSGGENCFSFCPSILSYRWLSIILGWLSNWFQPLFCWWGCHGRYNIFHGWILLLFAYEVINWPLHLWRSRYESSIFHWLRILWNSWQILSLVHIWLFDWWIWLQHQFWLTLLVSGFVEACSATNYFLNFQFSICLIFDYFFLLFNFLCIHLMHVVRKFLLKCLFLCQTLRNISWLSKFVLMFEPLKIVIMNVLPVIVFALTKSWVCSSRSLRVLGQEGLVEFLLCHAQNLRTLRWVDTAVQQIGDESTTSTPPACVVHSIQGALQHLHLIIDV